MKNNLELNGDEIELILKNHLKIESKVISIESLLGNMRMKKKIVYDPYYQRNYVWDNDKATYFIESILLGTEIPPLVFFKTENGKIEVIDGRQRYESLSKFLNSNLSLTKKGLTSLKALRKYKYSDLDYRIQDIFLDTKLRIIEFSVVNEPKITDRQEDLIKKEIFRRYNSGITPLTTVDIHRAMYTNDDVTNFFKNCLMNDKDMRGKIDYLFFNSTKRKPSIDAIMHKIRKILVLHKIPVKYYSRSNNRQFVIENFYKILMDEVDNPKIVYDNFINKINLLWEINKKLEDIGIEYNKLIFECLIWMLYICETEDITIPKINEYNSFYLDLVEYINSGLHYFSNTESHFYKSYEPRYEYILEFIQKKFGKSLINTYILSNGNVIKNISKNEDENNYINIQLEELKELKIDKAEPSSTTIEDLNSQMLRKRFLIRPTYQREEVINIVKSSSIIESILLDIKLPPIFIYRRIDGISEVVDGQQRLLTILGFIGQSFCDEDGKKIFSKKNEFKLKDLRILSELDGFSFNDLDEKMQEKIYDFNLSIVTIDQERNPGFNPIDLFIRLNNKPYPIRENTFEMWNSYIDKDIITKIKGNVQKNKEWMYFRKNNSRMLNEEMYTFFSYLSYKFEYEKYAETKILDIYQKDERINFRISNKKEVTKLLELASKFDEKRKQFLNCIKNTESFIRKLRLIIIDTNIENEDVNDYLKLELNKIFKVKDNSARRSLQDFYALWYLIQPINLEMIRINREVIKSELKDIFAYMKHIPENSHNDFKERVNSFWNKYKVSTRRLRLSTDMIESKIKLQKNICPLCGGKLFIGDLTNNDHIIALSVGGDDDINNIQVVHESCNFEKGCH